MKVAGKGAQPLQLNNHISNDYFRDCEFFRLQTSVLGETTGIQFSSDINGQSNPIVVDFGVETWEVRTEFPTDCRF